jgi:hypothetical protein
MTLQINNKYRPNGKRNEGLMLNILFEKAEINQEVPPTLCYFHDNGDTVLISSSVVVCIFGV